MRSTGEDDAADAERTAWARNLAAPVRDFLGTETGSASVLLAARCCRAAVGELAVVSLLRVAVDDEARDQASGAAGSRPTCATGSTRG